MMKLCPRRETEVKIAAAAYCTECGEKLPEHSLTESRRPIGKYRALHDWLTEQTEEYVTPTFSEISDILGFELPDSASRYPAWWANQNPPVSQTRAWLEAGWHAHPNLRLKVVIFRRAGTPVTTPPETVRDRVDAAATLNAYWQEEEVTQHLERWLAFDGWEVAIAHLSSHGIDIDARRREERWVIEVKGRGSRNGMRHNYFLNVLGQITQRMSDPDAKCSIAVPDLPQFRRLLARYPDIAKQQLGISCLFVGTAGRVDESK
jgi:hypothetical protein